MSWGADMAGGYTHLSLVRSSINIARDTIAGLDDALDQWGRFAYLGGVSPDYPYLGLDSDWADLMHKGRTDRMIKHAMPALHRLRQENPEGMEWRQRFAWLLGFVTHVIADVTIHPVVNIRVGKYEQNKSEHRRCEMNQDVHIYARVTGLDLHVSDNMKNEVRGCGTSIDLEDGVEELWRDCLDRAYSEGNTSWRPNKEQIDRWHAMFIKLVDLAEIGRNIPMFGRHMAGGAMAYPANEELDAKYFTDILVPVSPAVKNSSDPDSADYEQPKDVGQPSSFQSIFEKTRGHVLEAWQVLADDMFNNAATVGTRHVTVFGDWSLDTGIDNASKRLRLWPWDRKLV